MQETRETAPRSRIHKFSPFQSHTKTSILIDLKSPCFLEEGPRPTTEGAVGWLGLVGLFLHGLMDFRTSLASLKIQIISSKLLITMAFFNSKSGTSNLSMLSLSAGCWTMQNSIPGRLAHFLVSSFYEFASLVLWVWKKMLRNGAKLSLLKHVSPNDLRAAVVAGVPGVAVGSQTQIGDQHDYTCCDAFGDCTGFISRPFFSTCQIRTQVDRSAQSRA